MMKKTILIITVIISVLLVGQLVAATNEKSNWGNPFKVLYRMILDLKERVSDLEDTVGDGDSPDLSAIEEQLDEHELAITTLVTDMEDIRMQADDATENVAELGYG